MTQPHPGNHREPNLTIWLAIFIVLPTLYLLYSCQSTELKDTKRYSRFQSFVIECDCRESGTGYTPDGVEETTYLCAKRGGETSFSEYAQFIDESYEPRGNPTRLCPTP